MEKISLPITDKRLVSNSVIEIGCHGQLPFIPGQYIRVILDDIEEPKERSRCFNLVSIPNEIRFAFIRSPSKFKNVLLNKSIGSKITIKGPFGKFLLPSKGSVVFIALGIGITPFLSMIRYATKYRTSHKIYLLYKPYEDAYIDTLRELESINPNLVLISDINNIDNANNYWYIAGPSNMVSLVRKDIIKMTDEKFVKTEEFTGY